MPTLTQAEDGAQRSRDVSIPADATDLPSFEARLVLCVAGAKALYLVALSNMYGLNAADLHQLAQGRHLAWAYIDTMPFTPVLYRLVEETVGVSSLTLHAPAIFTGSLLVVVSALLARELGGGRWAQVTCALLAAVGPAFLGSSQIMFPQIFDFFFFALASLVLLRILRTGAPQLWIVFGFIMGVGILNKITIAIWLVITVATLLMSRQRRALLTWWFAAGMAITAVLVLPSALWLLAHRDEFSRFVGSQPKALADLAKFLIVPVVAATPFGTVLWARGLRPSRPARPVPAAGFLGIAAVLMAGLLWILGANPFHSAALILPLAAVGAAQLQGTRSRQFRVAVTAGVVVTGLALAPFVTTIVPEDRLMSSGVGDLFNLNYFVGYRQVADDIAAAYHDMPDGGEPATILTYTSNEAAVLDYWHEELGVPRPISGENNFGTWGPGQASDSAPVLVVGFSAEEAAGHFVGCRELGTIGAGGQPMDPNERGRLLLACERPAEPWSTLWPQLLRFERI